MYEDDDDFESEESANSNEKMDRTVEVVAEKNGVFLKWLRQCEDARRFVEVTILDEKFDETEPEVVNEEESDSEETEAPPPKPTASTETSPFEQVFGREIANQIVERSKRLKKVSVWNSAVPRIGPYTVTVTTVGVKLNELRGQVFYMEDSTLLSDEQRFLKYREDGYILLRNVFSDEKGQTLLRDMRHAMCKAMDTELGMKVDSETMELKGTSDNASAHKKPRMDVDHTVCAYPLDNEIDVKVRGWPTLIQPASAVLNSPHLMKVIKSFEDGASEVHKVRLKCEKKFEWARVRGRQNPRKEWTEYYFLKRSAAENEEGNKFESRYLREVTRRKSNPSPRYGFSAWIAAGPNPIDGGNLALLPSSQYLTGFLRERKNEEVPVDFRKQAVKMPWVVEDLNPGDLLLVDMQTTRAFVSNRRSPPFVAAFVDAMYTLSE